ncbi:putative ArsR family transcriptional regulator [Kineococcus xinjiangensis]|uniref:Putative ArsR family transcriptional regulator n=1 Tax=Kineococcus xinjiangensis TaxID=512762 RepID=A0A2S6IPN7_9ACTN|nr:putative ArsR family transcriptional regulator [Kineococcus xinjiangensis]
MRAAVAEHGPVTVAALAPVLGLTVAAVRRHLDAMEAEGVVEVRGPSAGGRPRGRGRPAREYVVSSSGHRELPAGYDEMALSALAFLAESGGPAAVEGFAEVRARALEARLVQAVEAVGDDVAARVQALAGALAAEGYAASARPVGAGTGAEGTQLCQGHCPVQRVAERFPQLCEAEARAFERVLGTRVQRLATLAHGDHVCTAHVSAERRATPRGTAATQTPRATSGNSRPTTEGHRR